MNHLKIWKFTIALIIILLNSCSNDIDIVKEKEYIFDMNNILYYKGKPFTGNAIEYYENSSQIQNFEPFRDGKRNGTCKYFDRFGHLRSIDIYEYGTPVGIWEEYSENGQILGRITYKNGHRISIEKYNEVGQLIE